MQTSVDGKIAGPEGYADWVPSWGDNYGLMPRIDACVLGGGMYPGHERYWSSIEADPSAAASPEEVEWARFAARTPHYVLSTTLTEATWTRTTFLRSLDEVAALKQQAGKDIYLVGGARVATSLIEAGLVDELHLHIHPLVAGEGDALFGAAKARRGFELADVRELDGGRVSLTYRLG
jgi:dihydrofolate reductase